MDQFLKDTIKETLEIKDWADPKVINRTPREGLCHCTMFLTDLVNGYRHYDNWHSACFHNQVHDCICNPNGCRLVFGQLQSMCKSDNHFCICRNVVVPSPGKVRVTGSSRLLAGLTECRARNHFCVCEIFRVEACKSDSHRCTCRSRSTHQCKFEEGERLKHICTCDIDQRFCKNHVPRVAAVYRMSA